MGTSKKRAEMTRSSREKSDDSIMGTNDSSIVSKRSVSRLYYPDEPDFYEPFAPNFHRRSPLINRGYWLRMQAIEQVVRQFVQEKTTGIEKLVVNLGCGYDPLPFQFWNRYPDLCQKIIFVDVDYPQLIEKKRNWILSNDMLRCALGNINLQRPETSIYLQTDRYIALGCNLRDLEALSRIFKDRLESKTRSILFVGEVSLTYMNVTESDALITWASTFDDARFCLLEQYLPDGTDHPFARTMLKHFDKLSTPIHAVHKYPLLEDQRIRFTSAGWPSVEIRNLWDFWSDLKSISAEQRRHLDSVEPFDEWEEFALFAGHYFLLVATTKTDSSVPEHDAGKVDLTVTGGSDRQQMNGLEIQTPSLEALNLSPRPLVRRFGAGFSFSSNHAGFHGGHGLQNRLSSVDTYTRGDSNNESSGQKIGYTRMCHTITAVNDAQALLVGGRSSPNKAFADCWLLSSGELKQVESLEPARFRHNATKVSLSSHTSQMEGVLVFGGKTSSGQILDDWCMWSPDHGWQAVATVGPRPSARFGAALCLHPTSKFRGSVMGGMSSEGIVLEDLWEWELVNDSGIRLRFKDRSTFLHNMPRSIDIFRCGACIVPFDDHFLLLGGVAKSHILTTNNNILPIRIADTVEISQKDFDITGTLRPLLVGFSAVALSACEILISGGGAVCFSMGSFWNEGYTYITKNPSSNNDWKIYTQGDNKANSALLSTKERTKGKQRTSKRSQIPKHTLQSRKPTLIPRTHVHSQEEFQNLVSASRPVILKGLSLGTCTELWTNDYLITKIGPDREIVIHDSSSSRMTFKDKNFRYTKKPFKDFIDGIGNGEQSYLRAVSASQPNKLPTKLEDDFPCIADDFSIPPQLSPIILPNLHSSPLRISGPVSLWLHYDVLANILCQIHGTKTLRLYPPSDVKYLDFPPGGSSSNTDPLTSSDPKLQHTHPHIASLSPGDILFIPPMWSHTATPEDGVSVAVNVFWRNLEKGYAAGKDVYGNRDLQAYENGRRDVEKILKAFKGVPTDMAKFYLDRLAGELQERADRLGA